MKTIKIASYGTWQSPITTDLIVSEAIGLEQIVLDGEDIYWLETRPMEAGRCVVVRRTPDGAITDVNPPPYNARSLVHEMGGGAFSVFQGSVYFCNFQDQRLYRQESGGEPRPITLEAQVRYADMVIDGRRRRLIAVCEDHTHSDREAVNTLISLSLDGGGEPMTLAGGNDFYSSPRLSPDGKRLAWLTWNHPDMPWDGTELWLAELDAAGAITRSRRLIGGADESIFQPEWSPEGALYFISDRSGWWNLYRWHNGEAQSVLPRQAEFGLPQWVFGLSTYAFESAHRIICTYVLNGTWRLASLDTTTGKLDTLDVPYTTIGALRAAPGRVVFLGASPSAFTAVIQWQPATGKFDVIRQASELTLDPAYLSLPEPIEFPTERGVTAHAFYYAPKNPHYRSPLGEKPPLRVISHGGPTGATGTSLALEIQYWTSRGMAVLDVDYGGSTGYGRDYRRRLNGRWGVVDVEDCINGARYLVQRGDVDGARLIIKGGSAGGYTTLSALTFYDVFKAGASYYGISDLEALARDTHKFESRYLERLIGPYPERRDLYRQRSPIHFVEQLSCPVIFFQGLEDKIVPPSQTETLVKVLRQKGLAVAYVPFAGEQHGFRRAENIKRALQAELYFYGRVFGFRPADPIEPVPIENLQ